ncbi:DUF4115 domain-containing protein [Marinomonas pontica]|uniref:RodZ domain-containing protein n=1 Tax=Marinomonas pontica TaxID=264739 RepID=UPI0022433BB7|nr:RodZ domain-containing protein [Marinomonas pontica]MCW8356064.1 DUF4115 domain-containing protein [Marinomonas pontica]
MTTEFQTDVSVSKVNVDTINIGKRLKVKRLELEFDERHVATELKIPIDQVRALESNNFKYFRSTTFARGFLKSYCRLLGVEPSEILNAFDAELADAEPTIKPVDKVNKQTHLGDPIVMLVSVVIVAVLVFLVFWWPAQSNKDFEAVGTNVEASSENTASAANDEREAPVLSNEANEPEVIAEVVSDKQPQATSELTEESLEQGDVVTGLSAETMAILEEAGVSPEEVVRAAAEVPAELATEIKAPSYSNDVVVTFDADCWTEVRDASGKILFSGVKSAGSELTLTGKAPYRVVLGYAKGVSSLKYKGEDFDFSSFTRKDLARFELK